MTFAILAILAIVGVAQAHVAPWGEGMYCRNVRSRLCVSRPPLNIIFRAQLE